MDLPDVALGAIIYLPVQTDGALLYIGDCHAIQGDGELCGVMLEIPSTITIQVDLIKNHTMAIWEGAFGKYGAKSMERMIIH